MQLNMGFGLAAFLFVCAAGAPATQAAELSDREAREKIDASVFKPYLQKDHPKTFLIFGNAFVRGPVQMLRERVALHAAKQLECDKVLWAEVATLNLSKNNLATYADCQSGWRYRLLPDGTFSREPIGKL